MPDSFPSFDHPPVVETVFGVQFAPLAKLTNGHLGWFWKERLGSEWTQAADAVVLPMQIETFGTPAWATPAVQLSVGPASPAARLQVTNSEGDRMIQVQSSRFHYNWQKKEGNYPHYRVVRQEFDKHFETFRRFVSDKGLGEVVPNQWELSYIDFVPPGDLWRSPSDWQKVLPALFGTGQVPETLRAENVGAEWHFEIVPQRGRLHLNINFARIGDREPGILLQWTARGPVGASTSLDAGLELGHSATVEAFLRVTSEEAQRSWGRREK
jgi:uncharacterized protein (TIGR04255 family)